MKLNASKIAAAAIAALLCTAVFTGCKKTDNLKDRKSVV